MNQAPQTYFDRLVATAAREADTTVKDIMAQSRFHIHVRPRQAVMLVASKRYRNNCQVARLLGKHPSTVRWGAKEAEFWMTRDDKFRKLVLTLEEVQ